MASSPEKRRTEESITQTRVCLACGAPLRQTLERLGSLRCLDCREQERPLDTALVRRWSSGGAHI
jgi:hypothetical protein